MMLLGGFVICVIAFIAVIWWEISKPLKGVDAPNIVAASALDGVSESDTDDIEINPATGLIMTGGFDGAGNPYGFTDDH